MADTQEDSRLKEVVKKALVEVLEERPDLVGVYRTRSSNPFMNATLRGIIFFAGLMITAILLFQIIRHTAIR
jgi:hypothetical protein